MKETAIHLRALEPEDLDMLYQIENNRELWSVGVTNVPYSRYILQEYIATQKGDIYADRQVRLMIEDLEGECVGIADIINFEVIEYGDPDNSGNDLKGYNQVYLRAEAWFGWAILDGAAFARIEE